VTFFSLSDPHQLNIGSREKREHTTTTTTTTTTKDLQLRNKESLDLDTDTDTDTDKLFEYMGKSIALIDFNVKKNQLSQMAILELKNRIPIDWFSIAQTHIIDIDTVYSLENYNINTYLFGTQLLPTDLIYFYQKNKVFYMFENLEGAIFYTKTKNELNNSKSINRLFQSLTNKGQVSFCTFPSGNINFLKRSTNTDLPFWNFLNKISVISYSWYDHVIDGRIQFERSAYKKADKAKFIPVYSLNDTKEQHLLYLKKHQLTPNLIRYTDNDIQIIDKFGEIENEFHCDGNIISIDQIKDHFFIQTSKYHYTFNDKWDIVKSFSIEEISTKDYLGYFGDNSKHKFFYQQNSTLYIKDDQGSVKKEFVLNQAKINKHEIKGEIYFSQIKNNLLSLYNG